MTLASYYSLLRKKEEELQRVYHCEAKLLNSQAEFQAYQRFVMEPELSSNTWDGKKEEKFQQIRHEDMLESYQDMMEQQFSVVFDQLSAKANDIKEEINLIRQMIAQLEAQQAEQ
ncbi:DUF5082 domain-containing protein [Parageobacillus thermoglucosidasius]|uniref:DUF5082 domain-containing protein n=1 Tax=Parageobacillus thermoglucosidasius TaxID=1426 RepID=UPI0027F508A1|nr:DUF5082 domain-containing protein [Parageobacillus thermoglucosidasius]MED4912783.1 DUF5082 domain-containing protein [Parageobacillus thermoglucosidasius]MED4945173.1 DUF5082 domain-containing protein [Parageobacillus thermoglucosidasius]MED4982282.1 DUF5082 domain-containing protein [Parageobacillus thermoglucosidasius]GMN98885.1 hypothetical protein PthstB1num2_09250 [Parageobacillus thermoglucosidasius]